VSCAFSPDGKRIMTASGHYAWLWDDETGVVQATLEGHSDTVWSCAFSSDRERIATASNDSTDALGRRDGRPTGDARRAH